MEDTHVFGWGWYCPQQKITLCTWQGTLLRAGKKSCKRRALPRPPHLAVLQCPWPRTSPHSLSSPPPFGPQLGRSVLTSFWTMGLFSVPFPPICSIWLSLVVTLEGTTDCQTLFQLRRQGCFWLEPTFESGGWGDKPIAFLG